MLIIIDLVIFFMNIKTKGLYRMNWVSDFLQVLFPVHCITKKKPPLRRYVKTTHEPKS